MHIAEGYLPPLHAAAWGVAAAPFVVYGARAVVKQVREDPETKLLLGAAGAFCFVLSALKLPSVTGSCSHPTGTGFGAVLFRPPVMALLGTIVLFFQATLLAHGGLTTLGANVFSMAIAGPWVAYGVYVLTRRLGGGLLLGVFLAAALGDLATYCVTSVQLALAFPDAVSGVPGAIAKFGSIFAITQIPLAVSEGLLTVLIVRLLTRVSPAELGRLGLLGRNPEGGDGVKRSTLINWLLVAAVVVIAAVPLLFVDGEYGGADGIAAERIAADHPDYVPWASALFEPSEEVASGLFAAQAAIGAGFLGYYFGAARTRRKLAGPSGSGTPDPTS